MPDFSRTLGNIHASITFMALSVHCLSESDLKAFDRNYGKSWMFFPDGHESLLPITLNEDEFKIDGSSLAHSDPDSKISLWLFYDRTNSSAKTLLKETGATNIENFTLNEKYVSDRKTKFIIHGWNNNIDSDVIQMIKNSYLKEPEEMNIIGVDWGKMAMFGEYFRSAASTRNVGKNVAAVIDHMVTKHNARMEDMHVIGHSLGAHTAGYAGMYTKSGNVSRITGLDPAFPNFRDPNKTEQTLDPSDAQFVDVIHSCAGLVGQAANLGHVDFFPNGGVPNQPGCGYFSVDISGWSCSHSSSYHYFSKSIANKDRYMARQCESWNSNGGVNCVGESIPMGDASPKTATGKYFVNTENKQRFVR